ncbi:hypothetical protein [Mycobacterium sp. 852013-50091_SCH5140682]|uniref:hypothetical protein n=1 Tax=Mycobacterium sp. 852013-50091_SCH5140682 TaxID=1834109 RepID=UPI0012EA7D94|nr:hypothetical protein [Mycobacterium sp. 852013-50091_SCH5140682]
MSGGGGSTTVVGTTGNGNTTQQSNRSGQIFNRQTTSALPSLSFRPPTSASGPVRSVRQQPAAREGRRMTPRYQQHTDLPPSVRAQISFPRTGPCGRRR